MLEEASSSFRNGYSQYVLGNQSRIRSWVQTICYFLMKGMEGGWIILLHTLRCKNHWAKVSGNRRHAGRQEYSWNVEPKTSLIQLQLIGMWLNQQYIQEWNSTTPTATQGNHHRARKEMGSAKAKVQSQQSTSIPSSLFRVRDL